MSAADDDRPLAPATLDAVFASLLHASRILVAVSGGPDSVALLGTLARWCTTAGRPGLAAATVDHGLRPEAAQEAEAVAAFCRTLAVPHAILRWERSPRESRSQDAAGRARYALLTAEAARIGATDLATAHHRDDQAETVLMRLAAGSGLAGLAGMRPVTRRGSLRHVRPFLTLPKSRLVATCRAEGWSFVEDRSNVDPAYARARWRRLMPVLAAEGLDAARLLTLSGRLARAEQALAAAAEAVFAGTCRRLSPGGVVLDLARVASEPAEIGIRILARVCEVAAADGGREPSPLRLERLETCHAFLLAAAHGKRPLRRTLAGCLLALDRDGLLTVTPEPPRRRGRGGALTENAGTAASSLGREGADA